MPEYKGLIFIGDPHLASRVPGFRKDDYPEKILGKLAWCLEYADAQQLLPCLLGDTFNWPRDNSNWLVGEVCRLLVGRRTLAIFGNHDCRENALAADDSLSVLVKAGLIQIVDERNYWKGMVGGRQVIVGGTSWGEFLPDMFWDGVSPDVLVFWMVHHDVRVPGYETIGTFDPGEIAGIDVVVNGHIHTRLPEIQKGKTRWITPGNIARIKRSAKDHVPSVLRVDIDPEDFRTTYIEIPHDPFEDVFHGEVAVESEPDETSAFIRGLAELQGRRTAHGAGLQEFLDHNLRQFEPSVADEIRRLSREVMEHA